LEIDALGVGQLAEDRHRPETRRRSNDADGTSKARTPGWINGQDPTLGLGDATRLLCAGAI
jgi:hypothetical protein